MKTETLRSDDPGIRRAVDLLRAGDLVAFPTETVYGLGADARNSRAVAGIFGAKERPTFNPLIVHVADIAMAQNLTHWSDAAEALARAFWPGPLSLVVPLAAGSGLSDLVTAGLNSVAIRLPAHPTAARLLTAFGGPIAAPSANPSGRLSPTQASHVLDGLSGKIAAVLDDGPCAVGLESTIIGLTGAPKLLRPGGVPAEEIEAVLGKPLAAAGEGITAPGQLSSHYAPNGAVRLNAPTARPDEIHLGFGEITGARNLSPTANLTEAAANLFQYLRDCDATGRPIAVAPIPETGLGRAVNDRLRRAAAPRP